MKTSGELFAVKELPAKGNALQEVKKEIDILKTCRDDSIVSYYGTIPHPENDSLWVRDS